MEYGMGCAGHDHCLFVLEFISQLEATDKEEEDRQKERHYIENIKSIPFLTGRALEQRSNCGDDDDDGDSDNDSSLR